MRTTWKGASLGAAAVLVFAACSSTAATPSPATPTAVAGSPTTAPTAALTLALKYGVVTGLTGDSATSGQDWNAATKAGVDYINQTLKTMGLDKTISVQLVDSQDSQGQAAAGTEAAKKLVNVDKVHVVMGDIFSSVTAAVAGSVTIPAGVVEFTGGTNAALTTVNPPNLPLLFQLPGADDLQAKVLTKVIGTALKPNAKINVAARNDAYGTGLAAQFKNAWTAAGGSIGQYIIYNQDAPTLDTEAQQAVAGNPDGWLFVDFCPTFQKLLAPLQRTGKWDASKSFGSDTLRDCATTSGNQYPNVPGMRATGADVASGSALPAYQDFYNKDIGPNPAFQAWTAEAFDGVIVSFLAALEARSTDPTKFAPFIVSLTNPPGTSYTFEQLDKAITDILAGNRVQYAGVSGPLNFTNSGRAGSSVFDIWQVGADGKATITSKVTFKSGS
jgi:branched-chain amino acid transport system substrate-binding protein